MLAPFPMGDRDRMWWGAVVVYCLATLACGAADKDAKPRSARHPMDPLSSAEYTAAIQILKRAKRVDDHSRYPLFTLQEPDKAEVLKWQRGAPLRTRAFATVKQGRQTFQAVVDITSARLVSWDEIQDVQPGILQEECHHFDLRPFDFFERNPALDLPRKPE